MIIKRPYAFLIKHFKIIHIIMLIMGAFVLLINSSITSFIKDFVTYGVYDVMNNPITKHIPVYLFLILIVLGILNLIVISLLRYKDKPWKLYLVPAITYIGLISIYILILLYFNGYTGNFQRTQVSLYRDLLNILSILQIPSLLIFLVRCLGLDLKKFNFQNDQEFLELDEKDQMEIEINIDVDKESIKRVFRRFKRNLGYFLEEHKRIVIVVATILVVAISFTIYKNQFVTNKSYGQNDNYYANGYAMKIKDVYYTNKSNGGKVINNSSAFVVIKVSIINTRENAVFKTDNFHLYNGIENYTDVSNQYYMDFSDFGRIYTQGTIFNKDQQNDIILIYRVDKKLPKDRFVLFYQEKDGGSHFLRKIKIKVQDVSTIKDNGIYQLSKEMKFNYVKNGEVLTENLAPDGYQIKDSTTFIANNCDSGRCRAESQEFFPQRGNKIVVISYVTEDFESKDIIDFSSKYGKINYIDSNNKKQSIEMKNATGEEYLGQYAYVEVPEDIAQSKTIDFVYTIRNNRYTYRVKG